MIPHPLQQWFPQFARALERAPMAGLMCAGAILLGIALAGARTSPTHETVAPPPPSSSSADAPTPLHEGTELREEPGVFQLSGDRLTFVPAAKKQRFTALENSVLERVAQLQANNPLPQQWIVSGTVTEYRGNHYLLMNRAVQKTPFLAEPGP